MDTQKPSMDFDLETEPIMQKSQSESANNTNPDDSSLKKSLSE